MKNILSIVSLSFFFPLFFCCVTDLIVAVNPTVWGFPKEKLIDNPTSDKLLLKETDFSAFEKSGLLKEVNKLGPGGAFYFSFRFDISTKKGLSNRNIFLQYSAEFGEHPWRRESLNRLLLDVETMSKDHSPIPLLRLYHLYLSQYPDDNQIREAGFPLLFKVEDYKSLSENYQILISRILKDENKRSPEKDQTGAYIISDRAKAFNALALIALDSPEGIPSLVDLLYSGKPAPLFAVLLEQLNSTGKTSLLTGGELNYLKGKILLSEKKYIPAFSLMAPAVNNSSLWLKYPQMIKDIRFLYHFRNDKSEKAEELLRFSLKDNRADRYMAAFIAGRIFRRAKQYGRAEVAFLRAYEIASQRENFRLKDFEKDEACWYSLWTILDISSSRFAVTLPLYGTDWEDPRFYDDLLERYAQIQIEKTKKGGDLSDLFKLLESGGRYFSLDSYIYYSWLCYLDFKRRDVYADEQKKLLLDIAQKDPMGYEGLLAEGLTGGNFDFLPTKITENKSGKRRGRDIRSEYTGASDADRIGTGFLDFDLPLLAYKYSLTDIEKLSYRAVRDISYSLSDEGLHYAVVFLFSKVCYREDFNITFRDLEVLFPAPYGEHVKGAAHRFDLDPYFIYSVIRTESAFAPFAGSHAGAQGLLQLMPSTAKERARELKMEEYDLHNSGENITLGAAHYRWLFKRDWVNNSVDALMAYNAGGGHLRRWRKELPGYDNLLFIESIDFKETRGYVRRVFFSLMFYHYIYNGDLPGKTIESYL